MTRDADAFPPLRDRSATTPTYPGPVVTLRVDADSTVTAAVYRTASGEGLVLKLSHVDDSPTKTNRYETVRRMVGTMHTSIGCGSMELHFPDMAEARPMLHALQLCLAQELCVDHALQVVRVVHTPPPDLAQLAGEALSGEQPGEDPNGMPGGYVGAKAMRLCWFRPPNVPRDMIALRFAFDRGMVDEVKRLGRSLAAEHNLRYPVAMYFEDYRKCWGLAHHSYLSAMLDGIRHLGFTVWWVPREGFGDCPLPIDAAGKVIF